MSKRRKYDIKNKRSLIIILIVSVLVVSIFSLFIYKYSKASKIEYKIESGSVLHDLNKNYLTVDDDATLKIRWNDNYYLNYNDNKTSLGKNIITYNEITGVMKMYGNLYEIGKNGKVVELKKETKLANTSNAKFYKITDRRYLLVANKIYSEDYSIEANNYLLVELDKAGNAKLSNNKINLKTISPTKLVTSEYSFDINNEILNFGQYDIDLKKIIGSTNQYKEDTDNQGNKDEDDTSTERPTIDNVAGDGTLGGGSGTGNVVNGNDTGEEVDIEDLLNKVKMTSIIRIVEGITEIDIDYVIYDPYNEYGNVYVEIIGNGKIEVIYLSKNDTHITLDKLAADTEYKLNFVYTTLKKDQETGIEEYVPNTFEELTLRTKLPTYKISVYKISSVSNTLTYKINLQEGYNITNANVSMTFNYKVINEETGVESISTANLKSQIPIVNAVGNSILGTFDITGYNIEKDTILKLTIDSVVFEGRELPINASSTFRFGR